ncbi:MAG: hypothetical protein Q9227_002998 [Pyrenula ochraceoflavens]
MVSSRRRKKPSGNEEQSADAHGDRPSQDLSQRQQSNQSQEAGAEIQPSAREEDQQSSSIQPKTRKRKRRAPTPDDAESNQIEPTKATMSDMTKDSGLGLKSRRENLLRQVDWAAVKEREEQDREEERRKEREARESGGRRKKRQRSAQPEEDNGADQTNGPQLRLVNGTFILDESSQFIDEHAKTLQVAEEGGDALNESNLTKRVNQSTIKPGRRKARAIRWDEENTEKFYEGLRMFGIDLRMIAAHFFEGVDRQHLKRKYIKEEHKNPHQIQEALSAPRKSLTKDEMLAMTQHEYEDPKDVYARIEEKVKELEAAQAEEENTTTDQAERESRKTKSQPSKEGVSVPQEAEQGPPGEGNRFDEEARRIVADATTSRATGRKKTKKPTNARKKAQRSKNTGGGTEEVLGSIEDVQLQ